MERLPEQKLEQAILREDIGEVKRLLVQEPSLVDAVNDEGLPMSFLSARTGNLELVRYIVEYSRASMNVTDASHRNILHYGAISGNLDVVRYLTERVGMDPASGDCNLVTPYDIAHEKGDVEMEAYFAGRLGFAYDEAYRNPIRAGFYPDPSIVRVGEDYYMVNSSFIFFPCIPVSHSRDLVHWEIIGYAITNPGWAKLDEIEGGRGYWAPDISYYKGRFYICATYRLNDTGPVYRRQMVTSSDRPEGPYAEPVFLDEDGIDPSIFTDDDGRRYMLLNRGARIFEISGDATRQIGDASLLYYGDHKRAPEGPHLLKKDGYYYLFEAEGGTGEGHRVTVSRSKSLFGIYEPCPYNPIMRQEDAGAAIRRCGHGKPVQTQDGRWYMVYLCARNIDGKYSMLGRETALDPITWTADGWPIVNGLKGPSVMQKKPFAEDGAENGACVRAKGDGAAHCMDSGRASASRQGSDFGKCEAFASRQEVLFSEMRELPLDWMTPRPPEADGIRFADGALSLKGSALPMSDAGARNILLRRQEHFCFFAGADMRLDIKENGQEAGLVCYYDENTWVSCGVIREGGELFVQVHEHIGNEDFFHGRQRLRETSGMISFFVETKRLERAFFFEMSGTGKQEIARLENVFYLCDEGLKRGKRFTGAMTGVYACAGGTEFRAEFTRFFYEGR